MLGAPGGGCTTPCSISMSRICASESSCSACSARAIRADRSAAQAVASASALQRSSWSSCGEGGGGAVAERLDQYADPGERVRELAQL